MSNQPASPWFRVTEDDHAAWVVMTALSLFIYTCLAIAAKITIRFNSVSLQSHDFILLAGMVFWAASVGCVVASCVFGLGRHQTSLDAASLAKFSKVFFFFHLPIPAGMSVHPDDQNVDINSCTMLRTWRASRRRRAAGSPFVSTWAHSTISGASESQTTRSSRSSPWRAPWASSLRRFSVDSPGPGPWRAWRPAPTEGPYTSPMKA